MRASRTRALGWGLAGVVGLLLVASAIDKLSGSDHAATMTASFGIALTTYRLLGAIELASAILFLVPRTGVLGTLLLCSYMGGAIATHLQHHQSVVFPAAIEALVWIAATLRFPELRERVLGARACCSRPAAGPHTRNFAVTRLRRSSFPAL